MSPTPRHPVISSAVAPEIVIRFWSELSPLTFPTCPPSTSPSTYQIQTALFSTSLPTTPSIPRQTLHKCILCDTLARENPAWLKSARHGFHGGDFGVETRRISTHYIKLADSGAYHGFLGPASLSAFFGSWSHHPLSQVSLRGGFFGTFLRNRIIRCRKNPPTRSETHTIIRSLHPLAGGSAGFWKLMFAPTPPAQLSLVVFLSRCRISGRVTTSPSSAAAPVQVPTCPSRSVTIPSFGSEKKPLVISPGSGGGRGRSADAIARSGVVGRSRVRCPLPVFPPDQKKGGGKIASLVEISIANFDQRFDDLGDRSKEFQNSSLINKKPDRRISPPPLPTAPCPRRPAPDVMGQLRLPPRRPLTMTGLLPPLLYPLHVPPAPLPLARPPP